VRVIPSALAVLVLPVLSLAVGGCNNTTGTGPTDYAPYSQTDLRLGGGTVAEAGKNVTVNYTGWLYDPDKGEQKGLVFDTSLGRSTFTFVLGAGEVIPGWDKGVAGMQVGGLRRLVVPPSLAYGQTRRGPIPPNTTLVFEIELLDVQ
jgi:FKBP-type peptidyl-prolyl cis-trans isomerase FkpA